VYSLVPSLVWPGNDARGTAQGHKDRLQIFIEQQSWRKVRLLNRSQSW